MIRVANAPCSWGALEFDLAGDVPASERVLDEMAEAAYAGTELGDRGFFPSEPDALHDALARRGLALVGGFVPVALASRSAHAEGRERGATPADASVRRAPCWCCDDYGPTGRAQRARRIRPEDASTRRPGAPGRRRRRNRARVRDASGSTSVSTMRRLVETRMWTPDGPHVADLVGLCWHRPLDYAGGDRSSAARTHGEIACATDFNDCNPRSGGGAARGD